MGGETIASEGAESLQRSLNALRKRQLALATFGEVAVALVADRSGAEVAVLLQWIPSSKSLSFLASSGLESKVLKFLCEKVGNKVGVDCLRARQNRFIAEIHGDPDIPAQLAAGVASEGGVALGVIPLFHQGSPTAVMLLFVPHPGPLSAVGLEQLGSSLSPIAETLGDASASSGRNRRTAGAFPNQQSPPSGATLLLVSDHGETPVDGSVGLDIGRLRRERAELLDQIADMRRAQARTREEARANEEEFENLLREARERADEATAAERELKKERRELQEALTAADEARSRMEAELVRARAEREDFEARVAEAGGLQAQLEAEQASLTQKEQQIEDLNRERNDLQQQLYRARAAVGRRNRDAQSQPEGTAGALARELEEVNEALATGMAARLQMQVEMGRLREQVTAREDKCAKLQERLEQVKKELSDTQAASKLLQTRLARAQSAAAQREVERYRIGELRAELRSLRISKAETERERDEARTVLAAIQEGAGTAPNAEEVNEESPAPGGQMLGLSGTDTASDPRRIRVDAARFEALVKGLSQLGSTRERRAEEFRTLIALSEKLREWPERFGETRDLKSEHEHGEVREGIEAMLAMVQETSAISKELNQLIDNLATAGNQFYELSSGLEKEVDSLRLVPLEAVYRRLRRPVRDAARQTGKLVDFVLRGGDLPIDRGLAEQLYSPLLHLVRNAVTHGIQSPNVREEHGKPRRGWISVSASMGPEEFTVTVKDDGMGIDLDTVFAKAVKKRLVDPNSEPTQDELVALIFRPGFSTTDNVSDLAGRGIGMDVVERHVKALGGHVGVHTEAGHGTVVNLSFPLPNDMSEST